MDFNNSRDTWPNDPASSSLEMLPQVPGAWEHSGEYDPRVENQLTLAKASRDQAEIARQRIAEEILDATRERCQELIASGNRALQNAKRLESEAEWKYTETQDELARADAIRGQAEAEREQIISEAKQQGQELINRMRIETEREHMDLKHQASLEAQRILAQARAMREAAREELEAQRIYADAARLKAWSHDVLMQAGDQPGGAFSFPGPSTNIDTAPIEPAHNVQPAIQTQTSSAEPAPSEEPVDLKQPPESGDQKKPARVVKAAK
jgi:hypothetical protein